MVCGTELCKDTEVSFPPSKPRVLGAPCSSPRLHPRMAGIGGKPYWSFHTRPCYRCPWRTDNKGGEVC